MAASLPVAEVLSMYGHHGAFDNPPFERSARREGPVNDPAKTASIFPRAIGFLPPETPASLAD
jgi:hypothetical protein